MPRGSFGTASAAREPELTAWLRRILAGSLALLARRYHGTRPRRAAWSSPSRTTSTAPPSSSTRTRGPRQRPGHRGSRREQAVLLADALEQLPPHYREVIVPHSLEG